MKRDSNDRKGDGKDMKLDSKDMKGHGKDLEKGRKETERDDKGMKKEREDRKRSKQCGCRMLIAAVMAAMVLCMGCSSSEETTGSDHTEETAGSANAEASADAAETPVSPEEEVTVQPEATQPDSSETEEPSESEGTGSEEPAEPEVTEDADEWTALYNDYKEQGAIDFTLALCEAGFDQICLVNGNSDVTNYFSVKDGNYYTLSEEEGISDKQVILYIPYTPTEFSCDNENIIMNYMHEILDDSENRYINNIQLLCSDFEGDDVPVNISVTFEDGSTQEITVYLTRHAEAE